MAEVLYQAPESVMNPIRILRRLWPYIGTRHRIILVLVSIGNILATLALTIPSLLIGRIVGKLTGHPAGDISADLTLLVLLFFLFAVLRALIHIYLHRVMPGLEARLRYEQIRHSLQAVDSGLGRTYASELNAIMGRGSKAAGDLVKISFADYMPAALQLIIAVSLASTVDRWMGLLMAASGVCSFIVTRAQLRSQNGVRVGISRAKARLDGVMTELLKGKAIVRTLNAVDSESRRVGEAAQDLSTIEIRHHRAMGLFDSIKMIVESGFGVAVVVYGISLVHGGSNPGTVLSLYLLYMQFSVPMREIHRMQDEANEAGVEVSQALEILDQPVDAYFTDGGAILSRHEIVISIRELSVRYPDGTVGVDRLSLEVPQGAFIGLCGDTGSGKSTLIRAIATLHTPEHGELSLFGQPLEEVRGEQFSCWIAYVSQDPYLVAATVRKNLTFGLGRDVTDDEILEACERAAMRDEIMRLSEGLDTMLGEAGEGLSGGQRQRIVIARTLLRQPRLILLDEATSALDNVSEAKVMRALEATGATMVAIAHRLSTLANADQIYVMSQGRIAQIGTYTELEVVPGPFRDLLEASQRRDAQTARARV
jgi:ATP-binding cassette subfamily B protein